MAFGLCPMLTQGAIEALDACTAPSGRRRSILPKLVSGEWTGAMNLTEPQAGSDLARADHPRRAGRRRRLPPHRPEDLHHLGRPRRGRQHRATWCWPACPTRRPAVEGHHPVPGLQARWWTTTARSATPTTSAPASIEHKLGIHGSPTCVMLFEGAKAELVGEPNQGLAAHVRDDERRAPAGRRPGRRHRRARLPAGAGLRAGAHARAARPGPATLPARDLRPSGRAPHADADEGQDRGGARHLPDHRRRRPTSPACAEQSGGPRRGAGCARNC